MKGHNLPLLVTNEGDEVDAIDVGETDDYSLFNEIQFRFHGKTLAFDELLYPKVVASHSVMHKKGNGKIDFDPRPSVYAFVENLHEVIGMLALCVIAYALLSSQFMFDSFLRCMTQIIYACAFNWRRFETLKSKYQVRSACCHGLSLLGLFTALPIISIVFKKKSDTSIATILCYYGFSLLILGMSVTIRLGQSQEVEYPQHLRSRVTTYFALPA